MQSGTRIITDELRLAELRRMKMLATGLLVAVALVFVVALLLVVIGGPLRDERYRALGAAPTAVEANAVAVFRSDATNRQMREALHAVGATIVGGPTVTDAYLLRVANATPEVLARLKAQPGVLSAEALQAETSR